MIPLVWLAARLTDGKITILKVADVNTVDEARVLVGTTYPCRCVLAIVPQTAPTPPKAA